MGQATPVNGQKDKMIETSVYQFPKWNETLESNTAYSTELEISR